jgi:preprotein translocase subunit SecE
MKDFFEKIRKSIVDVIDFLKDTRKELNHVSWPSWSEVRGTTIVVILSVFFFGFFLFIVDNIVKFGMDHLLNALSARP